MPDTPQARAAQLARSCARFLSRAPALSQPRLSLEAQATVRIAERETALLLHAASRALLAEYGDGEPDGRDVLLAGAARFAGEAQRLQQALDEDPALALLTDVFADVARDAARVQPMTGDETAAEAGAVAVSAVRRGPASTRSTSTSTSTPRRRRPSWRPPAEPQQSESN
jgi:hypothetical protein